MRLYLLSPSSWFSSTNDSARKLKNNLPEAEATSLTEGSRRQIPCDILFKHFVPARACLDFQMYEKSIYEVEKKPNNTRKFGFTSLEE